jgi:hypothetical protein
LPNACVKSVKFVHGTMSPSFAGLVIVAGITVLSGSVALGSGHGSGHTPMKAAVLVPTPVIGAAAGTSST